MKRLLMNGCLLLWVLISCAAQPPMYLLVRKGSFTPVGKNSSPCSPAVRLWLSGLPVGDPSW